MNDNFFSKDGNIFCFSFILQGGEECRRRRAAIAGQQVFMDRLIRLAKMVARESGNRKRKIERLQAFLCDPELLKFNFTSFDPIPLPLDPEYRVNGIISEKATLFKSNLMPCKFHFRTVTGAEYITIYKHGDDLRQDQLVLQIITLMDRVRIS
jgi:phosphatidylinositol 3-kinase